MAAVRAHVRDCADRGIGWRGALDCLRAATPSLWRALPAEERARLLRHAIRHWEVHRHRMAPAVGAELARLVERCALRMSAGRLVAVEREGRALRAMVRPRGGGPERSERVDAVVNSTGPSGDIGRSPLLASLRHQGLARADPLRLGLDVDAAGAVLDRAGRPVPGLLAVGPLRRGEAWESTAVPEIRVQAAEAAELILEAVSARRAA